MTAGPRPRLFALTIFVIAAGLSLRLLPLGLPVPVTKWGGSVLWGAMVYGLVGMALPVSRRRIVALGVLVALAVEVFRLVHAPGLDAFRLTLAGKLLIGRVFSPWNLVAYATGIAAAALADRRPGDTGRTARPTGSPDAGNPGDRSGPERERTRAGDDACSADPR